MGKIELHRDLMVWHKAMDMTVQIYKLTKRLPELERFGLISQITRAATSVPANIAEGNARGSTKDYAHFLSIARGSLMETETLLMLTVRLEYLDTEQVSTTLSLINEIDRMLYALRAKLLP